MAKPDDAPTERDIIGWRLWYSDGSVYQSTTHTWATAPAMGLVLGMLYFVGDWARDKPYRRLMEAERLFYVPTADLYGQRDGVPDVAVLAQYPDAQIKVGVLLADVDYAAIRDLAMAAETL